MLSNFFQSGEVIKMSNSQETPEEDFYDGLLKAMAEGIALGAGNFFSNIWVGGGRLQEDFFGFDDYDGSRVAANIDDDLRFVKAITNIIKNKEILYEMIEVIIEDTWSQLSYPQRKRVGEASIKGYTRSAVTIIIAGGMTARYVKKISTVLVQKLIITGFWRTLTGWAVKGAFLTIPIEALLSRASDESRMLKYQNPKLFNKLYPTGFDMLCFIFKPVVRYIQEY